MKILCSIFLLMILEMFKLLFKFFKMVIDNV